MCGIFFYFLVQKFYVFSLLLNYKYLFQILLVDKIRLTIIKPKISLKFNLYIFFKIKNYIINIFFFSYVLLSKICYINFKKMHFIFLKVKSYIKFLFPLN